MRTVIRPHPQDSEPLADYLRRAADLNLTTPAKLGWPFRDGVLRHADLDWDLLATATGRTNSELRNLTLFRYPATIAGTGQPGTRNTRWRASQLQRRCPACQSESRRRDWDLLLTMCCTNCRHLLRPAGETATYPAIPAIDSLLAHQVAIDAALADIDKKGHRDQLSRLHRLARVASLTADTHWPPTTSNYLSDLRRQPDRDWDRWTPASAPGDPIVVAVLVTAGWEALRSRQRQREFLLTAWDRIHTRGVRLTRRQIATLPTVPPELRRSRRHSRPSCEGNATEASAANLAAAELAASGITARNVPLMLTRASEFLPPSHELRRRHHLAALLRTALDEGSGSGPQASDQHTGDMLANDLRLGPHRHIDTPPTLAELRPYLHSLLPTPGHAPIDYDHNRAALTRVPRSVLRETQLPDGEWNLAAAWMWTHHTRGPLLASLHKVRWLDLIDFHRRLNPETRAHLDDLGASLLTWVDDLTNHAQPAADAAAATRAARELTQAPAT